MLKIAERNGRGGSMKKNPSKGRGVGRRMRGVTYGMHRRKHNKIEVRSGCGNEMFGGCDRKEDVGNLLLAQHRKKFESPGTSRKYVTRDVISECTKHCSDTHI
jgi:hypothetical protein